MAAVLFRVRIWLRHRIGRTIVAAVLIGLVAGLAMGLVAGTRRTASAPDRYTEWAGGEIDLALTQPQGDPATDSIAELDGVSEALSIAFVPAFPGRSPDDIAFAANPFSGDDHIAGTRVVVGRHTDRARPDEFTVNDEMAAVLTEQYGAQVGDEFQIYAFSKEQLESNRAFSDGEPPGVPAFTATWVGIVETPADFEESLPSLYYSPSFLSAHPTIPAIQTIIQVRLDPGTDPSAVLAEIQQLPDAAGTYPTDGQIVSEESRRAVRFQVTALWIVVGIALTATVFVIVQLVIRMLQAPAADASSMISLGWRRRDIAVERIAEALVAVAMAIPLAILVAWLVSEPFPIGSLDTFEPHPGPILDGLVVAIGSAVLVLAMIAGALLAVRAERTRSDAPARPWRGAGARGSMPLAVGAHFALVGRGGRGRTTASIAAGVAAMAGLVGAGVVAFSLDTVVDSPSRWGVNYDYMFGNPYIEADEDIVAPVVGVAGVEALSAVHVGSLTIDEHETATLAIDPVKGGLLPTVLSGRAPSEPDEIGLGAEVARRLDVEIGSTVSVSGVTGESRDLRVVGIVVTPDSAGGGAVVPFDTFVDLNPTATRNVLFVRTEPDAGADVVDRISAANFSPPDAMPTPTSVWALRRVLPAPAVLALVLVVMLVVGCAYLLAMSVRARRRDLAVLRALGARRRQLRAAVHWQATVVTSLVLLFGAPLGVVLGRWVVSRLTDTLGIVPGVDIPLAALALTIVGALVAANLLALLPARGAARTATRMLNRDR